MMFYIIIYLTLISFAACIYHKMQQIKQTNAGKKCKLNFKKIHFHLLK